MRWKYLTYICFLSFVLAQENTAPYEKWIKHLGHASWKVRDKATKSLIQERDKALPLLKKALSSTDLEIVWRAQYILNQSLESEVLEVQENTETKNRLEREFAIALKVFNNEKTQLQGIIQLKALGEEILPLLLEEIQKNTNYQKRVLLIRALVSIRNKEMITALIGLTEDKDRQVAQVAHNYLRSFTGNYNMSILAWKDWWVRNQEIFEFPK